MKSERDAWRPGMATTCQHCQSQRLTWDSDGRAICSDCGGATLPVWSSKEARESVETPAGAAAAEQATMHPRVPTSPPWWAVFLSGVVVGSLVAAGIFVVSQPAALPDLAITDRSFQMQCVQPNNVTRYSFDFWIANFGRKNANLLVDFQYGSESRTLGLFVPSVTSLHAYAQFNATGPQGATCPWGSMQLGIQSVTYEG